MGKASDAFRAQFAERAYPAALLERYEVIECLSSSENGETLLVTARDGGGYRVAKLTPSAEAEAESALLGPLSHPGLPTVYEQFTDGDTRVVIRSFVEGKPLDAVVAERRLPESESVAVCARLCDVLTYLHTRRPPIIHRDVKPQNVILGADGGVTLIDFGIARAYKPGAPKDTVFSGTSDFAPPEQYGFAQTDARADVYALGMLLKFLLTNGDASAEIVNPRLRRVVRRCTAFAPSARYASAAAVKRALLRSDGRRARRVIAVAAALAALVCGVAVGRYVVPSVPTTDASVSFLEPVVEQAARLALNKPTGSLTADDLTRVYILKIVVDTAYMEESAFAPAYNAWRASPTANADAGMRTLADLTLLPNLEQIDIVGGRFSDLDALASCRKLTRAAFCVCNELVDLSGVAGLPRLSWFSLIDCASVGSISPLMELPALTCLDLTGEPMPYDASALERLGDIDTLLTYGNPDTYRYVHDKRIGTLRLSGADITSLEPILSVKGLKELQLFSPELRSLEGIEALTELRRLDFWSVGDVDLSPLLALPNLRELALPGDSQADVSVLAGMPDLTITYNN